MNAAMMLKVTKIAATAAIGAMLLSGCGTQLADKNGTLAGQPQTGGGTSASQPAGQTGTAQPAPATGQEPQTAKQWTQAPEMKIDQNKKYTATVTTNQGTFTIELFAKDAPKTVNNFVFLSKEGFYNNVTFHRIIKTFMVQTGDPTGTGGGGPGYRFEDELKGPYKYEPGIVAMANAGKNTNGSQFFICTGEDSKNLNSMPNYTIFGKITEGMDVVQKIASTPVEAGSRGEMSKPKEKVTIQSVQITEA